VNRVQRYSSYTFTAYLAAHITNTSIIPLLTQSLPASDTYLLLTRPYYQSATFEPLLIFAPLGLHIASGVALRLHRRRQQLTYEGAETRSEKRSIPWLRISTTSVLGYALVPLAAGHFYINRALPLVKDGGNSGVGLQYVAHGFARAPWVSYIAFTALISVGVAHFVRGWAKWIGWTPETASLALGDTQDKHQGRRRRQWIITGIIVLVAGTWMAGGLGVVGRGGAMPGWQGRNYDRLFESVPIVGKLL